MSLSDVYADELHCTLGGLHKMKYKVKKQTGMNKKIEGLKHSTDTTAGRLFIGVLNGVTLKTEMPPKLSGSLYDFFGPITNEGIPEPSYIEAMLGVRRRRR